MKSYFGYIRVSTNKQGEVSLPEQQAAIERFAANNDVKICEWFEEKKTAATRGRAAFTRMLALLRTGKASGVIMHKIDRSARNLKDWSDLAELMDAGVEVHFVVDALDMKTRGGRLSADIQAVVAADFIRNLREETRKGFYGRLKQGLYPIGAPVGYLDNGRGNPKTPDPSTAPLVRRMFEAYATGRYSLRSLRTEIARWGLRNKRGGVLTLQGIAKMLANPFYCGVIRLRRTGETFHGVHEALIPVALFERVRKVALGKGGRGTTPHSYPFRRLIYCALCGLALIGERQKGHVYYRCHTPNCPTTGFREDMVDARVRSLLGKIQLLPDEIAECRSYISEKRARGDESRTALQAANKLQLSQLEARQTRLTDALIDGVIDRETFDQRKEQLMFDRARFEGAAAVDPLEVKLRALEKNLELAEVALQGYENGNDAQKRELLEIVTSNFIARPKNLEIRLSEPFLSLANREGVNASDPERNEPRTFCQRRQAMRAFVDYMMKEDAPTERPRRMVHSSVHAQGL